MALTIKQAYEAALQQASKNIQNNNSPTPAITANNKPSKSLSPTSKNRHPENSLATPFQGKLARGIGKNSTSTIQPKVSQENKTNQKKSSVKENFHPPKKAKLQSPVTIVRRSQPSYNSHIDLRPKPKPVVIPVPKIRLTKPIGKYIHKSSQSS